MSFDNRCRCCLTWQPEKDLKSSNTWLGKTEVYGEMLQECFEINISLEGDDCGICEVCIFRLRDAVDFKRQVVKCQKDFHLQNFKRCQVKDEPVNESSVKIECLSDSDGNDYDNYVPEVQEIDSCDSSKKIPEKVRPIRKAAKVLPLKQPLAVLRPQRSLTKRRAQSEADRKIVKKITQKYVQKVLTERKRKFVEMMLKKEILQRNHSGQAQRADPVTVKKIQKPSTSVPSKPTTAIENTTLMRKRHKVNLSTLIRNSNCTPFGSKSLSGYGCAFCKDTFPDPHDLRLHTVAHKNDNFQRYNKDVNNLAIKVDITDLACDLCKENIADIKTLKSHLIAKHNKRFYMEIKDYVIEFKLTKDNNFDCALCSSTFETFKMLLQHMNNHYRNYICDACGMGFINITKLKTHQTSHETGEYMCSFCDKVFATQMKKSYHEKFTHSRVRYTTSCPHCNESFQSYYKRNQHMVNVHNVSAASYKCNICDRTFLLKAQLTNHTKKVHLMERNHICTECGQGFYQKQYLREHMIKHNGERIHKCDVCNKAYARKKTLREHMRIHNNDRRHKCDVCGLAFVQKCSLKSHMLSNHGVRMAANENTTAKCVY